MNSFEIVDTDTNFDSTITYTIEVSQYATVKEVIKDVISNKFKDIIGVNEFGTITVIVKNINHRDEYEIKYKNGEIEKLDNYTRGIFHILQLFKIKCMEGRGCWGNNNWKLEIEIE